MTTPLVSKFEAQGRYFATGQTLPYEFRLRSLETLQLALRSHENELMAALAADLGKSKLEAFIGELQLVHDEIKFTKKKLRQWMRPQRVATALLSFHATSRILPEPLGQVLILGPWNYPAQLVLAPLVGALAAGNVAMLKPSELAPRTSQALVDLVTRHFKDEQVYCAQGDVAVAQELLQLPFQHIFFTGGGAIGRKVMEAAAKNLCPVTLELGGKSPCLLANPVDLEKALPRIVWGKFFNAGQTCVAPDYLLVPEVLRDQVVEGIRSTLTQFFGSNPEQSPDFGRIISSRHFDRLKSLLAGGSIAIGGQSNAETRFVAPTVLVNPNLKSPLMIEEIFGPLLPILTYHNVDEAIQFIKARPKPLALYLFTKDKDLEKRVLKEVPFGGGCVNDTLVHLGNPRLPFGGVGESGMGRYHGKYTFDTFSHFKTVVSRSSFFDWKLRFPPYGNRFERLRKWM